MLSALRASTLKKRELRQEAKVKNKTIVKRGRKPCKAKKETKEKVKRQAGAELGQAQLKLG